jgi:hypothetical protein
VLFDQTGSNLSPMTGFSPTSFTLNDGQSYVVEPENYGPCAFSHWADTGSTNPQRTVSISTNTQLTAVYSCSTSTINVSTTTSGATTLTGYDVTLRQAGVQLASCFSACSFTVDDGQTYQVTVANYGSETFNHWSDNVGTVETWGGLRTVNISNNGSTISLAAVYSP